MTDEEKEQQREMIDVLQEALTGHAVQIRGYFSEEMDVTITVTSVEPHGDKFGAFISSADNHNHSRVVNATVIGLRRCVEMDQPTLVTEVVQ